MRGIRAMLIKGKTEASRRITSGQNHRHSMSSSPQPPHAQQLHLLFWHWVWPDSKNESAPEVGKATVAAGRGERTSDLLRGKQSFQQGVITRRQLSGICVSLRVSVCVREKGDEEKDKKKKKRKICYPNTQTGQFILSNSKIWEQNIVQVDETPENTKTKDMFQVDVLDKDTHSCLFSFLFFSHFSLSHTHQPSPPFCSCL